MRLFLISLVFNFYWYLAVVKQQEYLWLLCVILFIACLLDTKLILVAPLLAIFGIVGDSILIHYKILVFENISIPLWLVLLWIGFTSYIYLIRDFLLTKTKKLIVCIASIGGSLSYLIGHQLNAVDFSHNLLITGAILAFNWSIYSLLFVFSLQQIADKFDK